mgnify:FL=1
MTSKMKIVALALVTIFTTSTSFATTVNKIENPEEVRYVGSVNDLPVYRLSLNNKNENTYIVSIKDNDGNVLFSEKISGKQIVRNYQIVELPSYQYSLSFEVNNISDKTSAIYEISKTEKIYTEVEVSKKK